MSFALAASLVDRGLVPDPLVRFGIRRLLAGRLRDERRRAAGSTEERLAEWRSATAAAPLAPEAEAANRQHYELPPEFFRRVLGPRLKYSCCWWPHGVDDLARAEEEMLALTAERAGAADGQEILDLGCGWGSLSLWLAERLPNARITAVSNSTSQGEHLRAEAARRGLANVRHVRADIARLELDRRFDRIVSVEMFEHLRNHAALFAKLERWLAPGGALFVHVFCHRELAYPFEDRGASDWMARHFFTGGVMPSVDLLPAFRGGLELDRRWLVPGFHYQRTAEAWLGNLDRHRDEATEILGRVHGTGAARAWCERWRVFFLACAELFGYRAGSEWLVAHYRFVAVGDE
jgi:cyclopropane-fatty-acyl-phospholipid synthase